MTWRIGPGPLIFVSFWLFFLVAGQSKLLRDPGTFWHTRVGEKVLAEGFFEGDPYTFTHHGQRWVPHQWLGEVVMALAFRVGGFDAFILLAATVLAWLFTWMTLRLLRTGLNFAVVAVVAGCALATTSSHLHVRPLLLTTVGIAVTAGLLCDIDGGRASLKKLLWLIPLFIAWANTHGGMLGGVASLALVAFGWIVWRFLHCPSPIQNPGNIIFLVAMVAGCGLTALVNPYGWEIPRAWLIIMRAPKIPELIEEHQPLDPTKPASWALFLFAAIYLFVLGGVRGVPRVSWLLPLFWLLQAFFRVRHSPLFAMTAFLSIAAMWPATRWAEWLARKRPDVYDPSKPPPPCSQWNWLIPVLLVGVSLILQASKTPVPVIGTGWAKLDEERWPVAILSTLQEHEPKSGTARIFNDCHLGGFLIFYTPNYRIFFDDRAELYGEDFLEAIVRGGENPTATFGTFQGNFDYALVKPDSAYDVYFKSRTWKLLASCPAASFYQRP